VFPDAEDVEVPVPEESGDNALPSDDKTEKSKRELQRIPPPVYNSFPGTSAPGFGAAGTLNLGPPVIDEPYFAPAGNVTNTNITRDRNQDAETAIISINIWGGNHIITAFYKWINKKNMFIYTRTSDDFTSRTRRMPLPSNYDQFSFDPYLAVNPYNSGVFPKTVYLVGEGRENLDSQGKRIRQAILGWRSRDGGKTWQGPAIIATGNTTKLDKPHIAVSWHPGTRGWIYVGYRDNAGKLVVRRSTNGGNSFSKPYIITRKNAPHSNGLQLMVSPRTGYVYAVWLDSRADRIFWAYSTNRGQTWTTPTVFPSARTPARNLLLGAVKHVARAPSLPIARLNWAANNGRGRISVVWHECSSKPKNDADNDPLGIPDCMDPGQHTDVYYASAWLRGGSTRKIRINDNRVRDQFMPALDFDARGNVLVTFYDRRLDSNNINYNLYRAWIDQNGRPIKPNQRVSNFDSTPNSNWPRPIFIGDYHETWMTTVNGRDTWHSSWTGENRNNADIFISTIHP